MNTRSTSVENGKISDRCHECLDSRSLKCLDPKFDAKHNDKGRTIVSGDGKTTGTVTRIIRRYCAACGMTREVYSVRWDGDNPPKRTYPCPAGCSTDENGVIHII